MHNTQLNTNIELGHITCIVPYQIMSGRKLLLHAHCNACACMHAQSVLAQWFFTYQSFLRVVSLLWWGLPLPAAAVVQPILELWGSISNEGVLKQVAPVLHGPPVPPPLS